MLTIKSRRDGRRLWSAWLALFCAVASTLACNPPASLDRVRQSLAQGDQLGALEQLKEIIEERPNDPEVLFMYGRTLVQIGRPSLAEWSLRKAMRDPEWQLKSAVQIAYGATATLNFEEAIKASNEALEIDPENFEVLTLRANAYADSRRHAEKALVDADRLLELRPGSTEGYRPKILALLNLDRIPEAAESLDALGDLIDDDGSDDDLAAWHCATMAIFAADGDDDTLAEERWRGCLERFPAAGEIVVPAVEFFDKHRKIDVSVEILRAAFDGAPGARQRYWVALSERLAVLGETEEGLALLEDAVERAQSNVLRSAAWMDLSAFHRSAGDFEAAGSAAEKAIAVIGASPREHPDLFFGTAEIQLRAGRTERALELAEVMRVPAHAAMIRAAVAHEREDFEEALSQYEKVGQLWPDNPFARYHAARAAIAIGQFDRGIEEYRHAIRIASSATDASTQLAGLLASEGNLLAAIEVLQQRRDRRDDPAELLWLEVRAEMAGTPAVMRVLSKIAADRPALYGKALVHTARGLDRREGEGAARAFLDSARKLRWDIEPNLPVLRDLINRAEDAKAAAEFAADVERATTGLPGSAEAAALEAFFLERTGADQKLILDACDRALKREPANAHALLTRAIVESRSDLERAIATLGQVAGQVEVPSTAFNASVEVLMAGVDSQTEQSSRASLRRVLQERLKHAPADGQIALALGSGQLAVSDSEHQHADYERRAARFNRSR